MYHSGSSIGKGAFFLQTWSFCTDLAQKRWTTETILNWIKSQIGLKKSEASFPIDSCEKHFSY